MQYQLRSYLHVLIQFSCLFYLILSSNWVNSVLLQALILFGILIGFWSAWVMRKSVLTIFPDPDPNIILIVKGPYRIIRHPMYTSLFLVLIPLVFNPFSYLRLAVFLAFTINQILKLLFEESLLLKVVPGYKVYMKSTWRLIPKTF